MMGMSTSSSTEATQQQPSAWTDLKSQAMERAVLPLSENAHKGSSGRVAVLGGSAKYTGAPYYAAMAALKAGADLAYVFTAQEAAFPIKCYSPELMVAPVYCAADFDQIEEQLQQEGDEALQRRHDKLIENMVEEVCSQIQRVHCLVIGPGLGRSKMVFAAVAKVIQAARRLGLHIVVDADALYMLSLPEYKTLLQDYDHKAVLTPNVVEYKRLFPPVSATTATASDAEDESPFQCVTIVRKGNFDVIEKDGNPLYVCSEVGGLKRSGGIGDVLAGTLGALVSWKAIQEEAKAKTQPEQQPDLSLSCWTACCFVKRATAHAFNKKKRSMTAPDVLDELGPAIDEMTGPEKD